MRRRPVAPQIAPPGLARVEGHFGELLQGRLGPAGPVVLVTLPCPVLAARLLAGRRHRPSGQASGGGAVLSRLYARSLRACLNAPLPVLTLSALVLGTAWFVQTGLMRELTPAEDRAVILLSIQAPQSAALDYTARRMQEIEERLAPLRASGEVTSVFAIAGQGAENRGFMALSLADWSQRSRTQQEIAAEISRLIAPVIGLRVTMIQPNSLGIRGAGQGWGGGCDVHRPGRGRQ